MDYDIGSYTEGQITAAIESADFDTAMALWRTRDWETYSNIRNALISVIRRRDSQGIELRHLQFIYFINKHLVPGCSRRMSDRQYFLKAA
jgi:NAD-dependent DNA ligase